jgi:hypothetical protein
MTLVALDTNLLVLLIVGRVAPKLLQEKRHPRLKSYSQLDFELLGEQIRNADQLLAIPNAWTEVSNILETGTYGKFKTELRIGMAALVKRSDEKFAFTKTVALQAEFTFLGVADCAWLCTLDKSIRFLTVDVVLHEAALRRGLNSVNFTHLRVSAGLI